MGKKIKGWKRRKNKIFKDFTLLTVPKDSIWLLQHYFTLFWPYLYYIHTPWGRKSNNFLTRRGRKSKTRGEEIKGRSTLYTTLHNEGDIKPPCHNWPKKNKKQITVYPYFRSAELVHFADSVLPSFGTIQNLFEGHHHHKSRLFTTRRAAVQQRLVDVPDRQTTLIHMCSLAFRKGQAKKKRL